MTLRSTKSFQKPHFYCYAGCHYTKCQYADCCIHVRNITKIQHNNFQQIDIQHSAMLKVTILLFRPVSHFYCYADSHYAQCHYADYCGEIRNTTNIQHNNIQHKWCSVWSHAKNHIFMLWWVSHFYYLVPLCWLLQRYQKPN